jgi:hypothetical protein
MISTATNLPALIKANTRQAGTPNHKISPNSIIRILAFGFLLLK